MEPTEDVPYTRIDEFATPEEKEKFDVDQENKPVLEKVLVYLDEAIDEHKSVDSIDLSGSSEITAAQQVAISKFVVNHLRTIKEMISDKKKGLK